MHFSSELLAFFNTALFICCLFCIKHYFWPGDEIRLPFHIFNLIFIISFYSIAIPFLINNIEYYSMGTQQTPLSILIRFFFGSNIYSIGQWIIMGTSVINILYIRKYKEDYINLGIPIERKKKEPVSDMVDEQVEA